MTTNQETKTGSPMFSNVKCTKMERNALNQQSVVLSLTKRTEHERRAIAVALQLVAAEIR